MIWLHRRTIVRPRGVRGCQPAPGFTLIELVVVVLIIAILAAIAIPSYRKYMIRSHRSAAESFMMEVADAQERFMVDNRSYAANLGALGYTAATIPTDVASNYTVASSSSSGPPPSFTITAVPISSSGQAQDSQCGTLTLTAGGVKSPSPSTCWK